MGQKWPIVGHKGFKMKRFIYMWDQKMLKILFLFQLLLGLSLNVLQGQTIPLDTALKPLSPQMTSESAEAISLLPYRLFLPNHKTQSHSSEHSETNNPFEEPRRMLVFLHGSGERGSDNEAQLKHGRDFFERLAQEHNTLVLVPQCPENLSWHNGYTKTTKRGRTYHYPKKQHPNSVLDILEQLIDSVANAEQIESGNILLGGLSMGGMGTMELLRRRPEFYKRAFVICGGAHRSITRQIGQTPLWFFHGEEDQIVDPKHAKTIYRKLKRKGIKVNLTLYPGVDHNSWDLAFAEQELIPWLMK